MRGSCSRGRCATSGTTTAAGLHSRLLGYTGRARPAGGVQAGLPDTALRAQERASCNSRRHGGALCSVRRRTNSQQEERAWKLLLLRERLLFLAPLRLGAGRRGANDECLDLGWAVRERVSPLLRGDWAALLAEARDSGRRRETRSTLRTKSAGRRWPKSTAGQGRSWLCLASHQSRRKRLSNCRACSSRGQHRRSLRVRALGMRSTCCGRAHAAAAQPWAEHASNTVG